MIVSLAKIDCGNISNWDSFHEEFDRVFGFPEFYGRNMDAWIDCMSYLSDPEAKMTSLHCEKGRVITIELDRVSELKSNCPEIYSAILECSAFVNWRLIESGSQPVLGLSFHA